MALNATAMKTLIKTKIEALSNFPTTGQTPVVVKDEVLQALCEGIVEHITGNAVVPATGTVTSGAGSGGGVSTTGTVT